MADVKFYVGGSGPLVSTETEEETVDDLFALDTETTDLPLSDLDILEKTIQSDQCYIRQASVHCVLNVLRLSEVVVDDVQPAFNAIVRLSNDEESIVRLELVRHSYEIAQCCIARLGPFQSAVYVYVLPIVVKLLCDCNGEVRKASQESLLKLMMSESVPQDCIESRIVPAAVQILDQDGPDELKAEGVMLMADVASCCSQTTTENVFLPRLLHFCTDMLFQVRKACAVKFGEFCSSVRQEVTESMLLPKFAGLTEDGVWGVRKACAESFVKVSLACSVQTRRSELVRIFLALINDQSRWVRMAAYQSLGGFISTFANPSLTGLQLINDNSVVYNSIMQSGSSLQPKQEGNCGNDGTVGVPTEVPIQSSDDESKSSIIVNDRVGVEHGLQPDESPHLSAAENRLSSSWKGQAFSGCESESSDVVDATTCSALTEPVECYSHIDQSSISIPAELCTGGQHSIPSDSCPQHATSPCETEVCGSTPESNSDPGVDTHLIAHSVCSHSLSMESESQSDAPTHHSQIIENLDPTDTDKIACEIVAKRAVSADADNLLSSVTQTAASTTDGGQCRPGTSTVEAESIAGKAAIKRPAVLMASLNEVSLPLDETVAHIGSTCVHVTDELSIVQGVVTPVESGVKMDVTQRPVTLSLKDNMTVRSTETLSASDDLEQTLDCAGAADLGDLSPLHMIRKDTFGFPQSGLVAYRAAEIPDEVPAEKQPPVETTDHPPSQQIVPQVLLDYYMSMTEPSRAQTVDCDIMYHCAYNFPAIVYTLGRQHWPYLAGLFSTLSSSLQWKVRRTIAGSLHCIAAIVGEDDTQKDLMPVFNDLLNDVDEVRTALVEHCADFIFLVPTNLRDSFLPRISELLNVDNAMNWRYRADVTTQLFRLYEAYTVDDFCRHILPVILGDLASDRVAVVRCAAVEVLSGVLGKLIDAEDCERVTALADESIDQFAHSMRWSRRQMYVSLCNAVIAGLLQPDKPLSRVGVDLLRQLVPPLAQLSTDPVPNVRIALARCLARRHADLAACGLREFEEATGAAVTALQNDPDRDVRCIALSVLGHPSVMAPVSPVPDNSS